MSEGSFVGCERALLVQSPEGVYAYIFEFRNSSVSKYDFLDETFDEAKGRCREDFGIPIEAWTEVD